MRCGSWAFSKGPDSKRPAHRCLHTVSTWRESECTWIIAFVRDVVANVLFSFGWGSWDEVVHGSDLKLPRLLYQFTGNMAHVFTFIFKTDLCFVRRINLTSFSFFHCFLLSLTHVIVFSVFFFFFNTTPWVNKTTSI